MAKGTKDRAVVIEVLYPSGRASLLFGWTTDEATANVITLRKMQMCMYYPSGGVPGLASAGPPNGSTVGKATDEAVIRHSERSSIALVMTASAAAVKAWEKYA